MKTTHHETPHESNPIATSLTTESTIFSKENEKTRGSHRVSGVKSNKFSITGISPLVLQSLVVNLWWP